MDLLKPHISTDFYKVAHAMNVNMEGQSVAGLHPVGISRMYLGLTPRGNSYFPYDDKMVVFGYEFFVHSLNNTWKKNFFDKPWSELEEDFDVFGMMSSESIQESVAAKFKAMHELGYLPLNVKSLPEGTLAPMRVPVFTIENTHPDFYWLPGYLETTTLANTFVTSTVASTARQFLKIAHEFAELAADSTDYINFQFHDFSQRGQHGDEAAVLSGIGHLASFKGSDSISAVYAASQHWKDTDKGQMIGGSVVATEHSIMESLGGAFGTDAQGQIDAWESLIDRNQDSILSVVTDTYDHWEIFDVVLPALKDKILARNGKLVLRPDSISEYRESNGEHITSVEMQLVRILESLYATFGGTINSKGYKVLDPHVGVLHGEGVTLENIESYFTAMTDAGFSPENLVFGVGAYVYSVKVSRDDFAQAIKASAAIIDGKEVAIFKKPKSKKESFKRSPKGVVSIHGESGEYTMVEELTFDQAENDPENKLRLIMQDGVVMNPTPLTDIRELIKSELHK